MTTRHAVPAAPGPLEAYATSFDDLFSRANQRHAFRQYLEGLLLPAERNKTLTALANTTPISGAQRPEAQALQWFLSESTWDPDTVNTRRLELLRADPLTAPHGAGVLVIDEHGDRKWGHKTAHIGKQYLANLGKVETGVVSVTSLFADESVSYPLHVLPYTPAHHFKEGKRDPKFRTKLKLARELVDAALQAGVVFRAVVADCFYGEDEEFKAALRERAVGYVLALKPSHAWWHREGDVGSLQDVAKAARWTDAKHPGDWVRVTRYFRDGHSEDWWALEVKVGPYGTEQVERAVIVTTDPQTLPEHPAQGAPAWYLVTNLPAPGSTRAGEEGSLPAADLAEIVRLYGLRNWVEQSYKQTRHALGWSQYQVRRDLAIRRHWQLVCCAFSFCWYQQSHPARVPTRPAKGGTVGGAPAAVVAPPATEPVEEPEGADDPTAIEAVGRGENEDRVPTSRVQLARGTAAGPGVAGALDHAVALLARVVECAPAPRTPAAA